MSASLLNEQVYRMNGNVILGVKDVSNDILELRVVNIRAIIRTHNHLRWRLVRINVSDGIGIGIGIGICQELESNSIFCLVGRK